MSDPVSSQPPPESRRASRILIVDDHGGEAPLLRAAIQEVGWNGVIETLPGGQVAIDVITRQYILGEPFDILLVDCLLAHDTVIHFLQRLHAAGIEPMPPVIIFTATAPTAELKQECFALGALRIFAKPATLEQALKTIKLVRNLLVERGDISQGGSWIAPGPDQS
jgi:CheY-like chemotaxis protein